MEVLRGLKEIAKPAHTALIIIDPQQDFCSKQGFMARKGLDLSRIRAAIPRLNNFIGKCREASLPVVWVREVFAKGKMLPNLIAKKVANDDWIVKEGGQGVEWCREITPPVVGEPIITKWNYDAFENTELDLILQSKGIKTLLMTGFSANVCVETTARHGFIKGYYIVAVSDCTDAPAKHEYESAMHNIRTYFGEVATSDEILALWK